MAAYMNEHVPLNALVETWEPEMGFLTDHNYDDPPHTWKKAVGFIWLNKPLPAGEYTFVQTQSPDYVLVGGFGRWVQVSADGLAAHYQLETAIGGYELYALKK